MGEKNGFSTGTARARFASGRLRWREPLLIVIVLSPLPASLSPITARSEDGPDVADFADQASRPNCPSALTREDALVAWSGRFGKPYPGYDPGCRERLCDDDLRLIAAIEGHRTARPHEVFCLSLDSRPITDAGLAHLRDFALLREIDLSNTHVTDKGMETLATCTNLVAVDLSNTRITDNGLESLGKLRRVTTLNLEDTLVTDAGLRHLAGMNDLQSLKVSVTGTGVAMLPQRKNLVAYLSATALPSDMPLEKLKELGLGVVKYPLDEFALKVFPEERLHIDADVTNCILRVHLLPRGAFEWNVRLHSDVLREWLATYRVVSLRLVDCPCFDDVAILGIRPDPLLESVVVDAKDPALPYSAVTDKGMAHLCRSKWLHTLVLPKVDLTRTGLTALATSPSLTSVRFAGGRIQSVPANHYEGSFINELALEGVALSPGALEWLARNCTAITKLRIANTPIHAQELRAFSKLVRLELVNTGLSDDDLVHLSGATEVEFLDLSGNPITGRGFPTLTALKSLRAIELQDTRVDAKSLAHLAGLPKLKRLDCRTSITDDTAQKLANRHKWIFETTGTDGDEDIIPESD